MTRSIHTALYSVLLLACAARAQQAALADLATFPKATLEIRTGAATHRFEVWLADTADRQMQGLMFVRDLPADRGMLFVHDPPRPASMWMKNTYIELDMLFVARGRIVKIVPRTRPHSLETVSSDTPVDAVIELLGGEVEVRKIKVGDSVRVGPAGLVWK